MRVDETSLPSPLSRPVRRQGVTSKLALMDMWLVVVTVLLSAYGVFAVYIAGSSDEASYAFDQALGALVGLGAAATLALLDYRVLQRYIKWMYVAVLAMLAAVFAFGVAVGGAQRWIDIGPVQLQPSEFAKVLMVVVLAGYISHHGVSSSAAFLKTLGIAAVPAFMVFIEPNLGTAMVFGALFFIMTFVGGARLWQLGVLVGSGLAFFGAAIKLKLLEPYQLARLMAFINPEADPETAYQVLQSKTAIGSGGFFGKGLDATTLSNLGYLPENHTDFIFANIAERLGFVGGLVLVVLFALLIWRILHIATLSRDRFGVLLCVGVATIFLFHIFVNLGITMGMMPVTGIPLPFISYGRSSLVVSLISVGMLQSVAIRSQLPGGVKSPRLRKSSSR